MELRVNGVLKTVSMHELNCTELHNLTFLNSMEIALCFRSAASKVKKLIYNIILATMHSFYSLPVT